MDRDDIDPRDARDAGRRLAARLVADQAQDLALSVLRQRGGEEISFDRGVVVVARRGVAARLVAWIIERSGGGDAERVPVPERVEVPPACGHSACRQHWIDTGDGECVPRGPLDDGRWRDDYTSGESDSTWATIAALLCIAALLALAFLTPGGA